MTTITPELKTFMEDLWGAEGDFINTPIGRGRIENVRTKVGIDLEVRLLQVAEREPFPLNVSSLLVSYPSYGLVACP